MADATLAMLAKEIRGKTLRVLDGVTDEQRLWTPAGTANHICWHAGHCLTVVEQLAFAEPRQVAGYKEIFFAGSKPAEVKQWPGMPEIGTYLSGQLPRLLGYINMLSEEELNRDIGTPERPRTRRYNILHALHDEACHTGEIHLLKKLWARR